jgi:ATP-binding cassette, subfamily B, multidrug efflux pump
MRSLMLDKTCFILAHCLPTIRSADLILVVRDGNMAESVTHRGLMERGGFCREMYDAQLA